MPGCGAEKPLKHLRALISIFLFAVSFPSPAPCAEAGTRLLPPVEDPASLHCLGFYWDIASQEAAVEADYRKAGEEKWLPAMPLFRLETATLMDKPAEGFTRYAGSIFNLEPGTRYEVRLTARIAGTRIAEELLTSQTWAEPLAPTGRMLYAAPGDGGGSGTREDPFRGLAQVSRLAEPGDTIVLLPGVYRGPLRPARSGAARQPIAWRGAEDGASIIDGEGGPRALAASGMKHIIFENLALRNADYGAHIPGCSHLAFRRCRLENVRYGISGDGGEERIFISDCVLKGRLAWPKPTGKAVDEHRGIELSGRGHVVCYNRISCFKDGIDTRKPGPVVGVDIHNNDISECLDDGIETDFSDRNVRVYENRLTNVVMAISFQPVYGGPVYALRNAMYNVGHEVFKLHLTPPGSGATSGGVWLHNTVYMSSSPLLVWSNEGPARNFFSRNNLFAAVAPRYAIEITCPMEQADLDNDLFAGNFARFAFWNRVRYNTIDEFRTATGLEKNGAAIKTVEGLFAAAEPPEKIDNAYPIASNHLALAENSPAIDRGAIIPNVNGGFAGKGPDIGCYEFGTPPPHYGPRPKRESTASPSSARNVPKPENDARSAEAKAFMDNALASLRQCRIAEVEALAKAAGPTEVAGELLK